jgi:hypothetical protein
MSFARYGEFRLQKGIYYIRVFNSFQERGYAPVKIFMKIFSELRISFYFNIDAGFSFMRRLIFRHYFLKIQIQQIPEIDDKKDEFQVYGIGKIPVSARKFVELPVILFFNDGEEIRL